ncbi:hypothetical protein E2P81_ATG05031 [Venturia nashicola]|nr:hypothetical protein E2P81_ATG05031 [Venturia nashicola]
MRMLQSLLVLVLLAADLRPALALPQLQGASTSTTVPRRKLTGKFLHITDIHPDPYYKTYSSTSGDGACHRGDGPAGYYGAETSDCDSPISLLNATFTWIDDNIRDDIDFVVWTGDSARHDNDEKIPRSERQVVEQNQLVVDKFREVFGKNNDHHHHDHDPTNDFIIPIIPTFGNNDILPHNIFTDGPNRWTEKYLDIWRQFIPEEQRHAFQSGGWFYVEAIRNELAVFSINTLYFFDSNSAVDGCAVKSEPGFEQFEWLRIQLQILRERGMKAILTGHVPPARVDSKTSWDETCWQKYALWMEQYRDVIVGSIYGHMNIDHFMLQDFKDVKKHIRKGFAFAEGLEKGEGDIDLSIASASDYLVDLRHLFAKIPIVSGSHQVEDSQDDEPAQSWYEYFQSAFAKSRKSKEKNGKSGLDKIGGKYAERYSMSFVSPSVVPNYFPTLRVFEYDVTGLNTADATPRYSTLKDTELVWANKAPASDTQSVEAQKKKKKLHKFKLPQPPSKSSPPGPAYSPQSLSWLGYTQYFANLTHINNDFLGESFVNDQNPVSSDRWKEGHHHGKVKKGKPNPKKFEYEVEYDTFSDKLFALKDLTVRSYVDLAKRIAKSKNGGKSAATGSEVSEQHANDEAEEEEDVHADGKGKKRKKKKKHNKHSNKIWYAFVQRAFVDTMDPTDVKQQFGKQPISAQEDDVSLEL